MDVRDIGRYTSILLLQSIKKKYLLQFAGGNACKRSCEVTTTDIYRNGHGVKLRIDDYTFNRYLCLLKSAATDKSFLVNCFSIETGQWLF